jgi:transcriptional regulator with XRE-family HTH domain
MLGDMGYQDKLKRLCALRGLDQTSLASQVGLTKSSISRILSGAQEPKLTVAYELAKALKVTLDYLVDDSLELGPTDRFVSVTEEELTILNMVRHMGHHVAKNRLLVMQAIAAAEEAKVPVSLPVPVARHRGDPGRGE